MSTHVGVTVLTLDSDGIAKFGESKTVKVFEGNILETGEVNKESINQSFKIERNDDNAKLPGEDEMLSW